MRDLGAEIGAPPSGFAATVSHFATGWMRSRVGLSCEKGRQRLTIWRHTATLVGVYCPIEDAK
jgi:hypothetical protein